MRVWVVVWVGLVWVCVGVLATPDPEAHPEADPNPIPDPNPVPDPDPIPDPDPARNRRQLSAIGHMLQQMQHSMTSLGRRVVPGVRYAADRFTQDVAPGVGQAFMQASNNLAVRAAEGFQNTAQVVSTRIIPAIEDKIVEASNAAIPYINRGIDALGTGFNRGAQMVTRGTSTGMDRLGNRVLGQKRHNRVKNIASNIRGSISTGLDTLASAISSFSDPADTTNQQHDSFTNNQNYRATNQDYHDYRTNQDYYYHDYHNTNQDYHEYFANAAFHANQHNDPHVTPYQQYSAHSHERGSGVGSVGEAVGRVVGNTAYALSSSLLGQNLTKAVAPIAKSVSQVFGQSVPAVSFGDGRIVIDLPGTEIEKSEPAPRSCTTPGGGNGLCQDLSDCPDLILDLTNLRKSVCFKSLFVPGVCCPYDGNNPRPLVTGRPPTTRPQPLPQPVTLPPTPRPQPIANTPPPPPPIRPITAAPPSRPLTPPPPIQPQTQCGVPQIPTFRVVGGEEAKRGQWPWMAAVWLHGPKKTEFWCGASLISRQYVLTAAHCTKDSRGKTFDPRQFSVRLGDHNIFSPSDDFISNPQTYRVSEIKPHPEFQAHGFYNDVALLKLSTPVDFTQYIIPVCLPDPALAAEPLDALVGHTPSVIGWGSTFYGGHENPTLREAKLPVWRNSDCDEAYFQPITEIFLCAGFVEGGKDACQGDSGGPLQLYYAGRWVQIGLVSFGNRCAEPGYPGVYTRITNFLPWILGNMV